MNTKRKRLIAKLVAVPVMMFFPIGVTALAAVTEPTTSSIDPMIAMRALLGLIVGLAVSITLYRTVWISANKGRFRVAVAIIIGVAAFDIASLPVSRMIGRSLSPDAFSHHQNQPNKIR